MELEPHSAVGGKPEKGHGGYTGSQPTEKRGAVLTRLWQRLFPISTCGESCLCPSVRAPALGTPASLGREALPECARALLTRNAKVKNKTGKTNRKHREGKGGLSGRKSGKPLDGLSFAFY